MIQKKVFFLVYIKMLEITKKNCYKCDLETNIDNSNQYFWINLRDFEAETESKRLNIFNKHGSKPTLKHRRELTLNIKFRADRIIVRNDLFEQVIKNCKATNTEFLMFKEKLGICLYEENYYEEEIIQTQDDIEQTDKEQIEVIDKVSNEKSVKKSNKKSTKKMTKELIEESDKEPIEIIDRASNDESNKALAKKMRKVLNKYSDDSDEELDEMFKELT